MNSDLDRTFRPRLESLEDRCLLTGLVIYRYLVPPNLLHRTAAPVRSPARGTHTPAQVHTLVNPARVVTYRVSIVPTHISLGLFDMPSPISVRGFDTGISNPGLRTPSILASDPGLTTPGLPHFGSSQSVTPSQNSGLTLSPQGIVTGSLF